MEGMLSRLYPDGDFSQEMELDGWNTASASKDSKPFNSAVFALKKQESSSDDSAYDSDTDPSLSQSEFLNHFNKLSIIPNPRRYFGKSSGVSLLRTAMSAKSKASNGEPFSGLETCLQHRHEFWYLHPWELDRIRSAKCRYDFPEPDLMANLIVLYFNHIAPMMPLLHRPTFMSAFDHGLHLRDDKFGALLLLVCATASRYSHDPRTLLEGGHLHSAGWKWFKQVEPFSSGVLSGPELYDLQIAALAVIYVHGTLPPHEGWILVGIGLRLAQDVGAHRRRSHSHHTVEDELWKRVFWVLLMLDIWTSSYLGRPCAISEENYDVDLPIECDDEYWENADPALAFKQPEGKPSQVSYFNHLIRINLLHSHALRTIYSLNKSGLVMGSREKGWEQHTVAELDSALNNWFDSIPDHLRWDPQRENQTFFIQSAALRVAYYFIQITIHRPFIPSFRKESTLSFPALTICASAARACSHVADALRKRYPMLAAPNIHLPTFVAGVIILLSLWGAKRSGTSLDPEREMQDVRKCIKFLELAESRWSIAGRLHDLLMDLTTAGNLSIPAESPPSNKREREDSDDDVKQSPATSQSQIQQHPQRSASITSATYPPIIQNMQVDISPLRRSSTQSTQEYAAPAQTTSISSLDGAVPLQPEAPPAEMFGTHPSSMVSTSRSTRKLVPVLVPQPYRGSYMPLGGSSGLGRAGPVTERPKAAAGSAPPGPFGSTQPLSISTSFTSSPRLYSNGSGPVSLSAGGGGGGGATLPSEMDARQLYDLSTSTSTSRTVSASASASTPASAGGEAPGSSSSSSSPQSGFQPSAEFGGGGSGSGALTFDMSGMDMEFGGYGVPTADKETMLRHFSTSILQDGQIGVDPQTMMMWSTMPSTYEPQDWETYMTSMLGFGNPNFGGNPAASVSVGDGGGVEDRGLVGGRGRYRTG
ncbi:fungal-specific transcription factor domain-containing protein [Multifurca ochricompacta]|uniref:Fungal-specific transcription factor domain-containing protein n=1 Tax=Multifurca ochricompacta TaxID=376703 RepID=A0AAD4M349_9AGAM|nr:fungal-specific transcription factor domain-containing protein [Multifurca ochricompacta]